MTTDALDRVRDLEERVNIIDAQVSRITALLGQALRQLEMVLEFNQGQLTVNKLLIERDDPPYLTEEGP